MRRKTVREIIQENKSSFKEEKKETVETTPEYWDCECDKNFIHPKSQKSCSKCGAEADSQPDSHASEVKAAGLPIKGQRETLKGQSSEAEYCDECGADYPETSDSLAGPWHKPSCSLYKKAEEEKTEAEGDKASRLEAAIRKAMKLMNGQNYNSAHVTLSKALEAEGAYGRLAKKGDEKWPKTSPLSKKYPVTGDEPETAR